MRGQNRLPNMANAAIDALVETAMTFSAAIEQQLEATQSDPTPSDFVQRTIAYATAKIAYFGALRAAMPELMDIATGRKSPADAAKSLDAHLSQALNAPAQ